MLNFNSTMFNGNRYLAFLYHTKVVQGFHIRARVDFLMILIMKKLTWKDYLR